jgi:hypothetical protein
VTLALELLGVPVRIRCDADDLAARLAVCYASSRAREPRAGTALEARLEERADTYRVGVDGREPVAAGDPIEAVRLLNHELMHGVMLRAPQLFYVHAAVVRWRGRGILLPGLSRAGKSTLALAFLEAGASYLSDELLAFDAARGVARAFPRALKIRDDCVAYFPTLADRFVGTGEGRFLPFDALAPDVVVEETPVDLVLMPAWSAGGREELAPLSPGATLLELAASSLNFGTHRAGSIDHLGALVTGTRAYHLRWREPGSAVARVGAAA